MTDSETMPPEQPQGPPASKASLTHNFIWTFIGNVLYSGCQWLVLIAIAKLGTPAMVGEFAFALAVVSPVILFANLQLRTVIATDASVEFSFREYLGMRVITSGLALLIILCLASRAQTRSGAAVILALGLAKAVESISDLLYGCLQQHERMERIARSMMLKGILAAAGMPLAIYLTHNIVAGALCIAATGACVVLFYDVPNCARVLAALDSRPVSRMWNLLGPVFKKDCFRKLLIKAGPLGLVAMLTSLNGNVPRYYIEHYVGVSQLGIFAAMAYLMMIGNTIANALAESAIPKLAKLYSSYQLIAFKKLLTKLLLVACGLGTAGVVVSLIAGKLILTLVYRPEYAKHSDVFVWLMLAAGIGYVGTFLGAAGMSTRAFVHFLAPYVGSAALSAAASALLIPRFGLIGAAWALSVVSFATCVVGTIVIAIALKRQKEGDPAVQGTRLEAYAR